MSEPIPSPTPEVTPVTSHSTTKTKIEFVVPVIILCVLVAIFFHIEGIFRFSDIPSYIHKLLSDEDLGEQHFFPVDRPSGYDVIEYPIESGGGDYGKPPYDQPTTPEIQQFPEIQSSSEDYSQYYQNLRVVKGVTWLAKPEPRGALGLVSGWWNAPSSYMPTELLYYKIGEDNGREILVTFIPCEGMCLSYGDGVIVARGGNVDGEGYEVLTQHTPGFVFNTIDNLNTEEGGDRITLSNAQPNDTLVYENLVPPDNLEDLLVGRLGKVSNTAFMRASNFSANTELNPEYLQTIDSDVLTEVEFVQDTLYGPLFRVKRASLSFEAGDGRSTTGRTQLVSYRLRLPGGMSIRYNQKLPFVGDDSVPLFTWSNGAKNIDTYRSDGRASCGGWGAVEVVSKDDASHLENEVVKVGSTQSGEPIFSLPSTDYWLMSLVFGPEQRQRYDATLDDFVAVSANDFLADHGVVLYKDTFGQYIVLVNTRYGGGAECAKPVIYLYPEEKSSVSVTVGADVTKSEPLYRNGWRVVAHPDGTLEHADGVFGSLFWDGFGHGAYPTIDRGFVVKRDEVEDTLRSHLVTLGFIGREIEDFIEYWMPLMPQTPYVRLSWLGTKDMDALAPLTISPQPDTVIRAFLDFEGVEHPYILKTQKLPYTPRVGFTAVEWGGLLR
jgi:hypothetical protein